MLMGWRRSKSFYNVPKRIDPVFAFRYIREKNTKPTLHCGDAIADPGGAIGTMAPPPQGGARLYRFGPPATILWDIPNHQYKNLHNP